MILKSSLSGNYTVTTSYANIENTSTGQEMSITIPEDGYYLITGSICANPVDNDATDGRASVKVAINENIIAASGGRAYHDDAANGKPIVTNIPICNTVYLKKDDVITVQAQMGTGDNSLVLATGSVDATYIEAINLTKLARGGM